MGFIDDSALDAGLDAIKGGTTHLYICQTSEPTDWASANSNKVGSKASPTLSANANGTSGRKFTVGPISTGGTVSVTSNAEFWALVDESGTKLWAAGPLSALQAVTSGNPFTLSAFDVTIKDAVDA